MSLSTNLVNAFVRVANEIKAVRGEVTTKAGDLASLTTVEKSNLVAALNEVKAAVDGIQLPAGVEIDDATASGDKVYSSTKVEELVANAIQGLIDGADEENNTLAEVAAKITALMQADEGLLSFKAPQSLEPTEQAQVLANLGLTGLDTDFVASFEAALA